MAGAIGTLLFLSWPAAFVWGRHVQSRADTRANERRTSRIVADDRDFR